MRRLIVLFLTLLSINLNSNEARNPTRPDFFKKNYIDFWNTKKKVPPKKSAKELFTETVIDPDGKLQAHQPPKELLNLLENPTEENAKEYIRLQTEKMKRINEAMMAVEKVKNELPQNGSSEGLKIYYFKKDDCIFCQLQDLEFKNAQAKDEEIANLIRSMKIIDDPQIHEILEIDKFPTILIEDSKESKVHRFEGFVSIDALEKKLAEIIEEKRE